MKTIKGSITETIIVKKDVSVEVPDDASEDKILEAVRAKAYEETILDYTDRHGWKGIETLDVNVEVEEPDVCYPEESAS